MSFSVMLATADNTKLTSSLGVAKWFYSICYSFFINSRNTSESREKSLKRQRKIATLYDLVPSCSVSVGKSGPVLDSFPFYLPVLKIEFVS